jgi:hypothetical protein
MQTIESDDPDRENLNKSVITFQGSIANEQNKDFVLHITTAHLESCHVYAEEFEYSTALMAHYAPKEQPEVNLQVQWVGIPEFVSIVPSTVPVEMSLSGNPSMEGLLARLYGISLPGQQNSEIPPATIQRFKAKKPYWWQVPEDSQQLTLRGVGAGTVFFGVFPSEVPSHVRLQTYPDKNFVTEVEVSEDNDIGPTNGLIHKYAAIQSIRELEAKIAIDSDAVDLEELKESIVKLACKYGVMSNYTSFSLHNETEMNSKNEQDWVKKWGFVPNQFAPLTEEN